MARIKDVAADFAAHLELLLDFHSDDEPEGEGQFQSRVTKIEPKTLDRRARYVTLENGQRLLVTVEAA